MLVLKRKEGQRIFVGKEIIITLVAARAGAAKIGIQAPPDVPVDREEIARMKDKQR
jgi:carbon storage regulator